MLPLEATTRTETLLEPYSNDPPSSSEKNFRSVLRGIITEETIRNLQPNKKLIIFVSSTFTDTYKERDILQEKILPELQKLGSEKDVQVLFYDMRFGVKDENTLDHTTWQCCQEGIRECYEQSDGVFFMSLQGDKYGYCPLPKLIEREFFENAIKSSTNEELLEMSQRWYLLNENYLAPKYELRQLRTKDDKEYWNVILPRLRDELLNGIPFDSKFPELRIGHSISEWEALFAKGLMAGYKVGIWVKKEFDRDNFEAVGSERKPGDFHDSLTDTGIEKRLASIKEKMCNSFEVLHPLPLQKLSLQDYVTESSACQEYLKKWEIIVKNRLIEELEKSTEASNLFAKFSEKYNLSVDHLQEMLHHSMVTFQKASSFIGRDELVEEALNAIYAGPREDQSSSYTAITAAIIGQSGAGKTALMAKIATVISSQFKGEEALPIITRYCGTSKFSLHGKDLIHSVCLQLLAIYEEIEEIQKLLKVMTNQSYKEAVDYFSSVLQRFPVILCIDSVDQLSNKDEARSKLSFLKGLEIHEKSKIIISTLPDEYDERKQQWKYRYLCEKVVRDHQIPVVEMNHHSANEATIRSLLERLLERRERKITADQWSVVLNSASHEPTMLYLNLSLEIITKWRSWERDVELRPTVKGLINQIFESLEKHYGKALVCYAFGFITFSRDGISDQEMKDCLSRPSAVFQEVCQYWQGVQTIPLHVWLRVKQAIKALLAEKDQGCLKWYHRQLWEAAQERYEEVRKDCHLTMGRYFSEQSLCVTELEVWHHDSKVNSRRVREGYYHLYESGLYEEAIEEMCSLEMVCASALCDDTYHSLTYLSKLHSQPDLKEHQKLDHYYRWMRKVITVVSIDPRNTISLSASQEPLVSIIKQENTKRFIETRQLKDPTCPYKSMKLVQTLGGKPSFDALVASFTGHDWSVSSVSWSHDDSQILSLAGDNTIKIWATATGELLTTLDGSSHWITAIAWNRDNSQIAAGFQNRTIKIWDSVTSELLQSFDGEGMEVTLVSWSPDSRQLATGSFSNINLWNPSTGKLLHRLDGLIADVTALAWHPDGCQIAAGAGGGYLLLWDSWTGQLIHKLESTNSSRVCSIAWNHDGSRIVAGCRQSTPSHRHSTVSTWNAQTGDLESTVIGHDDQEISLLSLNSDWTRIAVVANDTKQIEIWNAWTGDLCCTLQGHKEKITTLSWSKDGSQIVSGSEDRTIKIWKVSP